MAGRGTEATVGQSTGDLLIGLCGFATSFTTAGILAAIEHFTGLSLYTVSLWGIVPVGAILSGGVGASGYLLGARLLNRAPSRLLLLNVVLASVTTFLTIHYFAYVSLEVNGARVVDYVPFWTYLDAAIRSASLGLAGSSVLVTPSLGVLGYVFALLQVVGFALGGFVAYGYLVAQPYCERCARYLGEKSVSVRYTADIRALERSQRIIADHVQAGSFADALAEQQALGIEDEGTGGNYRTRHETRRCAGCGTRWMQYSIAKLGDEGWAEMPESTVSNRFQDPAPG